MASITKRHDGYQVRVRRKGTPTQVATFPTRVLAARWARMVEGQIVEGRHFPAPAPSDHKHTLGDAIDKYCTTVLAYKAPASQHSQGQVLRWWAERLGSLPLTDLTRAHLVSIRDELSQHMAPATVTKYFAAISHTLNTVVNEWAWLPTNPMQRFTWPREPQPRVTTLSDGARLRLLQACRDSHQPLLYPMVLFAICTGARRGEVLNLRWTDINTANGTVSLWKTKGREPRTVPLPSQALTALRLLPEYCHNASPWVFTLPNGHKALRLRSAFNSARTKAGLPNFRFHDLRHAYASYLAIGGATLFDIKELLGHSQIKTTLRYAHLTRSRLVQVVDGVMSKMSIE